MTRPKPKPKKMIAADVAWLRMEQPANPMTISGILMTAAPMPRETLLRLFSERLLIYDRFRMRVDDPSAAVPSWVPDDFDLERHVIPLTLPGPGDKKALERAVGELMSTPLSFEHAPWTFHHVERFEGAGRDGEAGSAIIARLHHSIGDGIGLMHVMLSLSDELWDPGRATPPKRSKLPAKTRAGRAAKGALGETWDLLAHPSHLAHRLGQVGGGTAALGQLLLMRPDSETLFKGGTSPKKQAAWTRPLALDTVKAIGGASGTKVNDVLLAVAAGALRRHLIDEGAPTDGVEIRVAVPVNVRPLEKAHELGNAFSLVFAVLPVGTADAGERLRLVKERMDGIKDSKEPAVVYGILQSIGRAPHWAHKLVVKMFSEKTTAVMTNVPGPTERLHLMGVPLADLMFWVPQAGETGLGLSILSYDGAVRVGVAADENLVDDPARLVAAFEAEFEALATRYG